MTIDRRIKALHCAVMESAELVNDILKDRDVFKDNNAALRAKLLSVEEHLRVSRKNAEELATVLAAERRLTKADAPVVLPKKKTHGLDR